jgi:hypothetical protein
MKPSNTDTQEIEKQLSSEQGADLAALMKSAGEGAPAPGEPETAPEPIRPDLQTEIAGLLKVAVATLGPLFPSIKDIYTDQTIGAASGAVAAVCEKRGWLQGGLMGEWAEEITALAVVGPLAFATYQGVKADIAAREPKKESAPAALAAPADDAKPGVVFGTVQHADS